MSDILRVERVLATSRAVLALCSLVAISIDPSQPTRYVALAYGLFTLYTVHSLVLVAWLRARVQITGGALRWIHGADVAWPVLITVFTEGSSSPFFLFFVFVVIAAAYRWGFRETLTTAAMTVVLLLAETAIVATGLVASQHLSGEAIEVNRVIVRATHLLLVGFLLGYLGEAEKRLRREHDLVARATSRAGSQVGLWEALRAVLSELMGAFDAQAAVFAVEQLESGRGFVWEARKSPEDTDPALSTFELEPQECARYFFGAPPGFWRWRSISSGAEPVRCIGIDEAGFRLRESPLALPESLETLYPHRALMAVSFEFRKEWRGRLFVVDPEIAMPKEAAIRLLRTLVERVGPTVHSVYLGSRLRAQTRAVERSRVAAEIHDGAVQSLIAVELEIEALKRRMNDSLATEDLGRLKGLVRKEVLELRDLMHNLSPVEVDSRELPAYLRDTVEKFRRETGIEARFLSKPLDVTLSRGVCRDLAQILREALVNVRKHSGATNVLVRFGCENGDYILVVDDDGSGFPFSGFWSQEALDVGRRGPAVIRERVRAIGAEMSIESNPGHGSRLEIKLSRKVDV